MIFKDENSSGNISGGITEKRAFTIQATAHAFKALSDSLYNNKVRAIIRELSANAYDSHIQAGHGSIPFEVHVPTYLEPYFSIRDFGVGLTKDEMFEVYGSYFKSTKQNTNSQVGCYGLGSKSPFCFTDSFAVTSIKNGIKSSYSLTINDSGEPEINLMNESPSSEKSGLLVNIPVKKEFDRFVNEAKDIYRFFNVRPKINCDIPKLKFLIETKDYCIYDLNNSSNINSGNNCNALMGNIIYPIDITQFNSLFNNRLVLDYHKGLILKFDIGEIEPSLSREGLQYKESTKKAITTKVNSVIASVKKELSTKADTITNIIEYIKYGDECTRLYSFTPMNKNFPNFNFDNIKAGKDEEFVCYNRSYTMKMKRNAYPTVAISTFADDNCIFVYDDNPKNGKINRIQNKLDTDSTVKYVYLMGNETKKIVEKELFNSLKIHNLSDLQPPASIPGTKSVKTKFWQLSSSGSGFSSSNYDNNWRQLTAAVPQDGCWAKLEFRYPQEKLCINTSVDILEKLGSPLPKEIYGFAKVNWDKMEKDPNWVNFSDYVIEQITKKKDKLIDLCLSGDEVIQKLRTIESIVPKEITVKLPKSGNYLNLNMLQPSILDIVKSDYEKKVKEAETNYRLLIKKYPLLKYVSTNGGYLSKQDIIDLCKEYVDKVG